MCRYNPSHEWLRRRIDAGEFTIQHMDVQTFSFRRTNTNALDLPRSWTDHLLWHHSAHTIDLFQYQTGERLVELALSHQLQGERAGLINADFHVAFMDLMVADPAGQAQMPHTTYISEADSEGIELVMWLIMRGAMGEAVHEVYRMNTSNTSNGLIILENQS